jgi:hypothetical protein
LAKLEKKIQFIIVANIITNECDGEELFDIYYAHQPTIKEQHNEPQIILPQQGGGRGRAAPAVEQYSFQTSRFSVA